MQRASVGALERRGHPLTAAENPLERRPVRRADGLLAALGQTGANHLDQLVGDHRDEQMALGTARLAVMDGAQAQFGFQGTEHRLDIREQGRDGCDLSNRVRGESSGSCASGLMGSCSYSCSNGSWSKPSNSCLACDTSNQSCDPKPAASKTPGDPSPAEHGACNPTEAGAACDGGDYRNRPDVTRVDGICRNSDRDCTSGEYRDLADTDRKYRWRCLGRNAVNYWDCLGIDGADNWSCSHGSATKSCRATISATDDLGCSEQVSTGVTRTCESCKLCPGPNEVLKTDGSCDCICEPGYQRVDGICEEVYLLTVSPAPTLGYVSAPLGIGDGIQCGYPNHTNCEEYYRADREVSPARRARSNNYKFNAWGKDCITRDYLEGATCTVMMTANKTISVNFQTTLIAEAGGPYGADYTSLLGVYTAAVTASATNGVTPYTFQWAGRTTGATAIYVYTSAPSNEKETVTVTDDSLSGDGNTQSDDDISVINYGAGGTRDAGDEPAAFDVPLGGELYFVWGEESSVTAQSGDGGVVGVSVSSPAVRVTGVGVGNTEVILQTESGEIRLPVAVQ